MMTKHKIFCTALLMLLISATGYGQEVALNNFIVKENLLKNNKIAIIAANEVDVPMETVNGTFIFSLNGFRQELVFTNGVAVVPQQIERSTFMYLKHTNDAGNHSRLYYIVKKEDNLDPYRISWFLLVVIPLIIIILAMLFKRFIIIALILLIIIFFFNYSQGLNLPTFFETIIDGLKSLI